MIPKTRYLLLLLVFFLGACSSGYEKEFSCSAFPDMDCRATEFVFEDNEGQIHDYRRSSASKNFYTKPNQDASSRARGHAKLRGGAGKSAGGYGKDKSQAAAISVINVSPTAAAVKTLDPGNPVLSTPKTMRILFLPWEDKESDLVAGGYVYVRLGEPEWLILKK